MIDRTDNEQKMMLALLQLHSATQPMSHAAARVLCLRQWSFLPLAATTFSPVLLDIRDFALETYLPLVKAALLAPSVEPDFCLSAENLFRNKCETIPPLLTLISRNQP